ncbi:hypothetical protein P20495_4327 [Pseudoalteromonas sp. BSi20495]|nr:hypothetical protein P20495_4327 [Pseudoalteromonas sp. BSi20495]
MAYDDVDSKLQLLSDNVLHSGSMRVAITENHEDWGVTLGV